MLYVLVMMLAAMIVITPALAFADIEDYIQTVCEQNSGIWSDENMACNDFESQGEQANFADALMDRDQYDDLVSACEDKGGEWSDKQIACNIQDEEEKAAYEDMMCDDGDSQMCQISQNLIIETYASSEEEEHCEDNGGEWNKEDKECEFNNEHDQEEYNEKKYKHFANKPENRGYSDWEYPESDK